MFTLHMVPSDSDTKLKLVHCQHRRFLYIALCVQQDATLCAHNLQALLPTYLICYPKRINFSGPACFVTGQAKNIQP